MLPTSSNNDLEEMLSNIQERNAQVLSEAPSIGTFSLFRSSFDVKPITREQLISNKKRKREIG